MAMTTNNAKNEEQNTNVQATQEAPQAVETQQPVAPVQEPEKKKRDLKGTLKKVGIGLGIAAGAVGSMALGYFAGEHHAKKSNSSQTTAPTIESVPTSEESEN